MEEFPAYKDIGNVYCSWFVVLTNFRVVLWGDTKGSLTDISWYCGTLPSLKKRGKIKLLPDGSPNKLRISQSKPKHTVFTNSSTSINSTEVNSKESHSLFWHVHTWACNATPLCVLAQLKKLWFTEQICLL